LEIAKELITDYGVIAIDDVFNIEWPSVSQALNEFLTKNKQIVPFCAGWGRLFLCRIEFRKELQEGTNAEFDLYKGKIKRNLRILTSFKYYNSEISIYTNRWGSASKSDLLQNAYKIGLKYQYFEDNHPWIAKIIRRIPH